MSERRLEVITQVIGETDISLRMMPVWVVVDVKTLTAKEIITRAVETQVKELVNSKRKIDLKKARRILIRQYMSQDDVAAHDLTAGTGHSPDQISDEARKPGVDVDLEIEIALEAVESGRVVMFVDGTQIHELDELVAVTGDTKIKFIRLTPLVGG